LFEGLFVRIKSQKDFFSGLMFAVVGGAFAAVSSTYTIGTGARMGPGYFPLVLGVLLAALGVLIAVRSFGSGPEDGDPVGRFAWRPLIFIISANLAFGACLGGLPSIGMPPLGLIVGIVILTFVASLASDEFNAKETLILSIVLSVFSYGAFIKLLNLQFPVWPAFLGL
jgi:hypothetical protein